MFLCAILHSTLIFGILDHSPWEDCLDCAVLDFIEGIVIWILYIINVNVNNNKDV